MIYGDISHPETLVHAGVTSAQILICTVPDALLKGTTNARLVRHLRELNPEAKSLPSPMSWLDEPTLSCRSRLRQRESLGGGKKPLRGRRSHRECSSMKFARSWTPASMDARKSFLSGARLVGHRDGRGKTKTFKLGMP